MGLSTVMLIGTFPLAAVSAYLCTGYVFEVIDAQRVVESMRQRVLDVSRSQVAHGRGTMPTFFERLIIGVARTLPETDTDTRARAHATRHPPSLHLRPPDPAKEAELIRKAGFELFLRAPMLQPLRVRLATLVAAVAVAMTLPLGAALAILAFVCGYVLGYRMPDKVLTRAVVRRRDRCLRDLPVMFDIVALGSAAGLSFDAAFEQYAENFDTPLAAACHETYLSYSHGAASREEALRGLARELEIAALRRFVDTVVQAMRFGTPLSQTLRDLAGEERGEQKARMATRAAKAPVRMLIPMGTLILPAMLILVLGPVVLSMSGEVF